MHCSKDSTTSSFPDKVSHAFAGIQEQEQQPEPAETPAVPAAPAIPAAEDQAVEVRGVDEEAQPDGMSIHLFPSTAIVSNAAMNALTWLLHVPAYIGIVYQGGLFSVS